MAKKGLITSLILGAVLTLSLGIYTLVTAIVALTTPVHNTYSFAYTSDQTITAFSDYSLDDGNFVIEYAEGQEDCLIFAEDNTCAIDTEKSFFVDAKVGDAFSIKAVATINEHGSTETFNVTIYKQGTGDSADNAYVVANTDGLVNLANKMETYDGLDETNVIGGLLTDDIVGNGHVSLVENVDLTNVEWKGLATNYSRPFNDVFNGNGNAVENMNIHVTAQNYTEYLGTLTDYNEETYTGLSVGFFRNTNGATISGLSLTNANVVIDTDVLALINPTESSTLEFIRAGLLVGDARNTTIDGLYTTKDVSTKVVLDTTEGSATFGQEIEVEEVVETQHRAVVNGTINGYAYGKQYGTAYAVNGLGGLAGVVYDSTAGAASKLSNYNVDLTVTNSKNLANVYIGAVAGEILNSASRITLEKIDANLSSNALFNNRNHIGAVAGKAINVDATELTTNIAVIDDSKRADQFTAWHNSDLRDLGQLTDVAGIIAAVENSTFANVISNAVIDIYSNTSAGFVYVEDSTLTNVVTSGRVTGYSTTGLAQYLYNSNVTFAAEAETELVAAGVTLSGWYSAGLADYVKDSDITATGTVKVNVTIYAKGSVGENSTAIQNTLHSAGLVGYLYSESKATTLSGFVVNATINNATDAAGLVAYLGQHDASSEDVYVTNCIVVANITSNTSATQSTTHKVGGAVATIYGSAIVDNVDVTICFNPNQTIGNKYGAAMFGGLVARIGGEYVEIQNCKVRGDAYINHSAYTKSYGSSDEYEQILAGGLVGAIASFGKDIPLGGHPTYGENTQEVLETATYDAVTCLDTANIIIKDNTEVSVNITIDFAKEVTGAASTCMDEEGYRARSAGSLIGLVMNGVDTNSDSIIDQTTQLDLSTNVVTGTVSADKYTFSFHTISDPVVGLSSMGYGNVNNDTETPECVGASFDLVAEKQYEAITFPTPAVEETPAA